MVGFRLLIAPNFSESISKPGQYSMAGTAAESRQNFLKASAEYYASLVPAISAHLMVQYSIEEAEFGSIAHKHKPNAVCKACGTLSVPGWNSRTTIAASPDPTGHKRSRSKKNPKGDISKQEKNVRITCMTCRRYEKFPLAPTRNDREKVRRITTSKQASSATFRSPSPSTTSQAPSKAANVNASSKKRAKSRKQGGLQAMLERSKVSTDPSSNFGLDLLDLMKQG